MLQAHGISKVNTDARGRTRELRVPWALEQMGMPFALVGTTMPSQRTLAACTARVEAA